MPLGSPVICIRETELQGSDGLTVVSSDTGEFALLRRGELALARGGEAAPSEGWVRDLRSKGLLGEADATTPLQLTAVRTRKSFLAEGPSLHIFVVTLRCDHSCQYCQVSRASDSAAGFDMSHADARMAVDRMFESPSPFLTVEFQGGEPALRFDLVRDVVEMVNAKNLEEGRAISFAMVSTLHHLTDEDLAFCRDHQIHLSTSIDGVAELHNRQRPNPSRDSWQRTVESIARVRAVMGTDAIAALPTLSRQAMQDMRAVVDTYVELGFRSIFLRPISPYGFARKTAKSLGATVDAFLTAYAEALDYILDLNAQGIEIEETAAAVMLRHILTPFHSGYMDLRSPAAAGLGVLVYNYDGLVYPSDEARMAAETGDRRFALGRVDDSLDALLASEAMTWLGQGAIAEALPKCRECAFVPYCGADPVHHAFTQGGPIGDRDASDFCQRQTGLFNTLFRKLHEADEETMRTFTAWAMRRPRSEIRHVGRLVS